MNEPQSNTPPITILEQLTQNLDPNETLRFNVINGVLHITRQRSFFIPGNCVCQYVESEQTITSIQLKFARSPETEVASAIQRTAIDVRAKECEIIEAEGKEVRKA